MIPSNSAFLPVAQIFSAIYSAVTPGFYNYTSTGNTRVRLQQVYPNRLYCIDIMNNSATCPEAAYVQNIVTTPSLLFALETTNPILFGQPYKLPAYLNNNTVRAFFRTGQRKDYLVATAAGILSQNASLVGFDPLDIVVSLNLFEITDKKFIADYYQRPLSEDAPLIDVPEELRDRV